MSATSRAGRATIAGYCAAGPSVCRLGGLRRGGLRRASGLSILAMKSRRHAGVASRRVELFVSEQRLNQPNVLAVLEQMGLGQGMTEPTKRDRLAQPRRLRRLLEQPAELARGRRVTINAYRETANVGSGATPASRLVGRDFHHRRNRSRVLAGKHHITVLAAFRLHDADDHLLAVDVAGSQPHHFAGPQPATIRQRQHRACLEARRHSQNALDLLGAQHRRRRYRLLKMPDLGRQIVATQRDAEQEAHPGHDPVAVGDAGAELLMRCSWNWRTSSAVAVSASV